MAPKTSYDIDVGYDPAKTAFTAIVPLSATDQDLEEIKSSMVSAFARTESVPESVMATLLAQFYRHTKSATHHYIQYTRVHNPPDEMYANRLMDNIRNTRKN